MESTLTKIGRSTIDLSLLPEKANILSIGWAGEALLKYLDELGHNIFQTDADRGFSSATHNIAISDKNGTCSLICNAEGKQKHIIPGNDIEKMTIDAFNERVGIIEWDLIKMNMAGEEYRVLRGALHPIAKQVSIQFHEHTPAAIGKENLDELLKQLSKFYTVHNQVWEIDGREAYNYWDILLIAK